MTLSQLRGALMLKPGQDGQVALTNAFAFIARGYSNRRIKSIRPSERRRNEMTKNGSLSWRERLQSPLTKHCAGFFALILILFGLLVELGIDSSALGADAKPQLRSRRSDELRALTASTLPLRGVGTRITDTGREISTFYSERIPSTYSSISTRIGDLEARSGVQLSQVQYAQMSQGPELRTRSQLTLE